MKYPPQHHQEANFENIINTIKTFPLATVISVRDGKPLITHLPVVYEANDGLGKLIAHIDRVNPQCELLQDDNLCTVIFNGPDTYISPSIYTTSQLPTYNYIKVHLEGKCTAITKTEDVKKSMVKMTEFLEGDAQKFKLDINDERMDKYVNYIMGFEIEITSWEGKYKLSQDKSTPDFDQAREALLHNHQSKMQNYLDAIYAQHSTKN